MNNYVPVNSFPEASTNGGSRIFWKRVHMYKGLGGFALIILSHFS